jgi:hypothetical protein
MHMHDAEHIKRSSVVRATEPELSAPYDVHTYLHPHSSLLIEALEEADFIEQVAETAAESDFNDAPGAPISLGDGRFDDPDHLARCLRESWSEGTTVLVRWVGERRLQFLAVARETDTAPQALMCRTFADQGTDVSRELLLLTRLFRVFDPMPERMCRELTDLVATGRAMSPRFREKWIGWFAHQIAMRGLFELPEGMEEIEGIVAPKIRDLLPGGSRSRRKRPRADGAVPGTLRYKLRGLVRLHSDMMPAIGWIEQVRTGLEFIGSTTEGTEFSPAAEIDSEVARYLSADGPAPDPSEVIEHREDLAAALRTSNTRWLHWTPPAGPERVPEAIPDDLAPSPPEEDRETLVAAREHLDELLGDGELSAAEALPQVPLLQAVWTMLAADEDDPGEWAHDRPLEQVRSELSEEFVDRLEAGEVSWELEFVDECERPGWITEIPEDEGRFEESEDLIPRMAFELLKRRAENARAQDFESV